MIGLDLIQDRGWDNQVTAFQGHIAKVREVLGFSCIIFLAVEQNLGGHATRQHFEWLRAKGLETNINIINECGQEGAPGITTSDSLKGEMTDDFQPPLSIQWIRIYAGLTGCKAGMDLAELRDQMTRWSWWPMRSKTPGSRERCPVSGKGATNQLNDDGAFCLLLNYKIYRLLTSRLGAQKYNVAACSMFEPLPGRHYIPVRMSRD